MSAASSRELLREPHVARLLATSMLARLPQGMASLAVLLLLTPSLGDGLRRGVVRWPLTPAAGTPDSSRGLPTYLAAAVLLTIGPNMAEVATVAFAGGRAASPAAGALLAVDSAVSLVGGLAFASRPRTDSARGLSAALGVMAVGASAAALAPGTVGLGVLLFLGGVPVSVAFARLYTRVGLVAPAGAETECFGWPAVVFVAGSAGGAALGGLAVDAFDARVAFALSGLAVALAAAVVRLWTAPGRLAGGR